MPALSRLQRAQQRLNHARHRLDEVRVDHIAPQTYDALSELIQATLAVTDELASLERKLNAIDHYAAKL